MYYVIETQTNGTTPASIITAKNTYAEAMQQYHTVLAAAAVSTVEHHACIVIDEEGRYVAHECYNHTAEE